MSDLPLVHQAASLLLLHPDAARTDQARVKPALVPSQPATG
ncbi:hypothetical protein AB0I84_44475 [Streptomyces spectabilis]